MTTDPAAGATTRSRVAFGMKLVLAREALPAEVDRLVSLFEGERTHYQSRQSDAVAVVGPESDATPDRAAWTIVANVLLNLDETVTKQ